MLLLVISGRENGMNCYFGLGIEIKICDITWHWAAILNEFGFITEIKHVFSADTTWSVLSLMPIWVWVCQDLIWSQPLAIAETTVSAEIISTSCIQLVGLALLTSNPIYCLYLQGVSVRCVGLNWCVMNQDGLWSLWWCSTDAQVSTSPSSPTDKAGGVASSSWPPALGDPSLSLQTALFQSPHLSLPPLPLFPLISARG